MKCLYCDYDVEDEDFCPSCGSDLKVYRRIRQASCICYNRALAKARTRDLSGAVEDLKQSLKFNKYNIDARNLLGLIYLELGEPVDAMGEWVISKNFMPYNNIADEYLANIQGDSSMLNKMDNATKKYNQVIAYIQQNDFDLAAIQLKRLVAKNPNMVKARSLLALLYLKSGDLNHARKELTAAVKIDAGNPTVNTYIQEQKAMQAEQERTSGRRRKRGTDDDVAVESAEMSKGAYLMDYSKVSVVNIVIGCIVGVLISVFLILPAIRQKDNDNAMSALIIANEDARSTENNLSTLREEIDTLKNALENYEGKADVKASYENLIQAKESLDAGDLDAAAMSFTNVTKDVLEPKGQQEFDRLSGLINQHIAARNIEAARAQMQNQDYAGAIPSYLSIMAIDEGYDEGKAMYELASCYEAMGDMDNALRYYERLVEIAPETREGRDAVAKVMANSEQP